MGRWFHCHSFDLRTAKRRTYPWSVSPPFFYLQFSAFCGLLVLPVREPHEFRGVLERNGQSSARVCPSGEHRMSWEVSAMAVRTSIGLIFESRFSKWFGVSVVQRLANRGDYRVDRRSGHSLIFPHQLCEVGPLRLRAGGFTRQGRRQSWLAS